MQGLRCAAVCATLLLPTPMLGSDIFRCTDGDGRVTFTRHGCPTTHEQHTHTAHNPRPGSGAAVPLAVAPPRASSSAARPDDQPITVVGERQDGCGNQVTGSARRDAIIKKQVLAGMTRRDVESALGKPERRTLRNGQTTYHYSGKSNGERRSITFDQQGCVTGRR